MAEFALRRIIIACDAASDIRLAVEEGAVLAERWNAALHGVFLEDENLFRLAGLPFGRQVTLSSSVSESLSATDLAALSSALGAGMRRTLAEAAAERGLEWSFGVVRDLPTVAALVGIEGDLLVVQGATRPFSGAWRPRSPWDSLPEDHARTTLIRRKPRTGPGTFLVLPGRREDGDRLLQAGLAIAGPADEVVVLLPEAAASDGAAPARTGEAPAAERRPRIRWAQAPGDQAALLRLIGRLDPALIVIDGGAAGALSVRDLLAGTSCDVLAVR